MYPPPLPAPGSSAPRADDRAPIPPRRSPTTRRRAHRAWRSTRPCARPADRRGRACAPRATPARPATSAPASGAEADARVLVLRAHVHDLPEIQPHGTVLALELVPAAVLQRLVQGLQ